MNKHKSSSALKSLAKGQLLGNYSTMVGAYFLSTLCVFLCEVAVLFLVDQSSIFGLIIYYAVTFIISLLSGLFSAGEAYINLKLICGEPVLVSDIFNGFKQHPDKSIGVQLYLTIVSFICMIPTIALSYLVRSTGESLSGIAILLIVSILSIAASITEIIVSLMLSQVFYILQDFPDYTARDAVHKSMQLMKGNKGRLFYVMISFIPLYLLGLLSCGIAYLWIRPYTQVTMGNFYMDLMQAPQPASEQIQY